MCRLLLATRKCPHIDSVINIYLCTAALERKPEQACPIPKRFCSICQRHSLNDEAQTHKLPVGRRVAYDHNDEANTACGADTGTTGVEGQNEGMGQMSCAQNARGDQLAMSMSQCGFAAMPAAIEAAVEQSDEQKDVTEEAGRANPFGTWKRDRERSKAMKMFEVKEKTVRASTRFEID